MNKEEKLRLKHMVSTIMMEELKNFMKNKINTNRVITKIINRIIKKIKHIMWKKSQMPMVFHQKILRSFEKP